MKTKLMKQQNSIVKLIVQYDLYHENIAGLFIVCRLLNQTYLQSIGVEFLPGYADPHSGRSVTLTICTHVYCSIAAKGWIEEYTKYTNTQDTK